MSTGDGRKRLFARPSALFVDSTPTRIQLPTPPPIHVRPPEPETPVEPEEEPAEGPARLFIGPPRAVAPVRIRAGLDNRTANREDEIDVSQVTPRFSLPIPAQQGGHEPPALPSRWQPSPVPATMRTPPDSAEPGPARVSLHAPSERAQLTPDSAEPGPARVSLRPPGTDGADRPAPLSPVVPAVRPPVPPEPPPLGAIPSPPPRAVAPVPQPKKSAPPFRPLGPPQPKRGISPSIWASAGALFLAAGILGTWWEIRDSVLQSPAPVAVLPVEAVPPVPPPAAEPSPPSTTALETGPGEAAPAEAIAVAIPGEQQAEPEAGTAATDNPPPEAAPALVETVTPSAVPTPTAGTPLTEEISVEPTSTKNPMVKEPLLERPVITAERPPAPVEKSVAKPPDQATGVLRITSPVAARVYIDGKAKGELDRDRVIELPPGTHEIKLVSKKTGRSQTQYVRIDSNKAALLAFTVK